MKHYLSITLLFTTALSFSQQVENRSTSSVVSEKKIVENINLDKYVEFAPTISADGKTMIFESDRNKGWKLFETKLDEISVRTDFMRIHGGLNEHEKFWHIQIFCGNTEGELDDLKMCGL